MKVKLSECQCERERHFETNVTYWSDENDKWPKPPQTNKYLRVHDGGKYSPCVYAFVHDIFVPASSLTDSDKPKFPYTDVQNVSIFRNYAQTLESTEVEAEDLRKRLDVKKVVPTSYIDVELQEFQQRVFTHSMEAGREVEIVPIVNSFMTRLMQYSRAGLEVKEERQLNAWFRDLLRPILSNKGFEIIASFPDNRFCVFGNSKPDLAYYKHCQGDLIGVVVDSGSQSTTTSQESSEDLIRSTIEFKMSTVTRSSCQCYANMIRLAHDLVIDSLRSGVLVDSVTVYALLVSHADLTCVPMKYYCDFKRPPIIQVGLSGDFTKLFYCTLLC